MITVLLDLSHMLSNGPLFQIFHICCNCNLCLFFCFSKDFVILYVHQRWLMFPSHQHLCSVVLKMLFVSHHGVIRKGRRGAGKVTKCGQEGRVLCLMQKSVSKFNTCSMCLTQLQSSRKTLYCVDLMGLYVGCGCINPTPIGRVNPSISTQ